MLPREAVREGLVSHAGVFVSDTLTQLNPQYVPARFAAERRAAAVPDLDQALDALVRAGSDPASDAT